MRKLQKLRNGEKRAKKQLNGELERWLSKSAQRQTVTELALESLAWCHSLPELTSILTMASWRQLLDELLEMVAQSKSVSLDAEPLGSQVLGGELPRTLSYLFPELASCKRLRKDARKTLSDGIVELLDGEGLLRGCQLEWTRSLLACWTRCGYLGRAAESRAFDATAEDQLAWFVRQSLRLTRHDGSAVFSKTETVPWPNPVIEAALDLVDDLDCHFLAHQMVPDRPDVRLPARYKKPNESIHSEWAETALLRCERTLDSPQLALRYGQSTLNYEVNCGGQTLCAGNWSPVVTVDGVQLLSDDSWDEVCWVTDADGDYLELQLNLGKRWFLQRQMFLARDDRFLFVADALLGSENADIAYESEMPLAPGIRFQGEQETREGIFRGKKRLGRLLPIALPEWRSLSGAGEITATEGGVTLSLCREGKRLLAPWFLDLDPERLKKPVTWRQLTVAEHLVTQAHDSAVGYRVQIGDDQWLIYRSLAPKANRTVLGQNFSTEFVLGRFTRDGETEKLVEIE